MFSEMIKSALERDVIGQPRAVDTVVRGATRLTSGLTPLERAWAAYLLIGPPGTGRTHMVRTLARVLHGQESTLTVSCDAAGHPNPWMSFVHQLAPLFERKVPPATGGAPRIVLVQDLESAPKALFPMIARVLETGQIALPDGRPAKLPSCMLFFTSGLCTDAILDERIGFAGASLQEDGKTEDTTVKVCREEAEKVFGLDLLAQLDDVVVFRRLEEEHLARVLERHFARMARWLAERNVGCELLPAARDFLLSRGTRRTSFGARDLITVHRREVEFPVADLLVSGRLGAGSRVLVDRRADQEHLHFTVVPTEDDSPADAWATAEAREVPVLTGT